MAHYKPVSDGKGDLIELHLFCSDWCHKCWCEWNKEEYEGWNGCHELQVSSPCEWCGTTVKGIDPD